MLTIASPNTDRSLLTLAELRAAAGVTDESRDLELSALGGYVSGVITSACSVVRVGAIPPTLRLESVVETFHCDRRRYEEPLMPSRRPIAAITSVTEGSNVLDPSAYEIDGISLYRLSGTRRACWQHSPVVVAYDAGWAIVPDDLRYAAMKFVQVALVQGGRDPLLKRKVTVGVSEYEWFVDLTKEGVVPPEVMDILVMGGYVNRWGWMR
jgi:hypothetical protein